MTIDKAQMRRELLDCKMYTPAFASVFMPNRFKRPFSQIHHTFFDLLDDDSHKRTAIAAPRGWGKTTIDTITFPARKICFRETKFVEIISCTSTVAAENVKNLGRELTGNHKIKKTFGDLKGTTWSEGNGNLETSSGIRILARGAGQQVRGWLVGEGVRPDLVVIDDLEDSEPFRIGDPAEYLRKTKHWFWSDLMNSLDDTDARVVYVGTILHEDSLLQNLLDDPDWKSLRLELCDDNYRSNFPEWKTTAQVRKLADGFARRGQLDLFYQEFRNMSIAKDDAIFKAVNFRHYPAEYDPINDFSIDRVVIVDPAKTVKTSSAYTAILGVGFDAARNRIYLIDCVNERLDPDQIYTQAFEMAQRLHTTVIGCEVTSLNNFIAYPFNTFLASKGYPPIVQLSAIGKKEHRIKELSPLYRMGAIFHNPDPAIHTPLQSQLLTFPRAKFIDVADAMAYVLKMFDIGERFFSMDEDEDEQMLLEEIAQLDALEDADNTLDINFRWAP